MPALSAQMRPPIASTSCLLMYSPRPVPLIGPVRSRGRRADRPLVRRCGSAQPPRIPMDPVITACKSSSSAITSASWLAPPAPMSFGLMRAMPPPVRRLMTFAMPYTLAQRQRLRLTPITHAQPASATPIPKPQL